MKYFNPTKFIDLRCYIALLMILAIPFFSLTLLSCKNNKNNSATQQENVVASPETIQQKEINDIRPSSFQEEKAESIIVYNNKKELPSFNEPDKSAEVFGSCFSKDLPAYEYIIRNPFIDERIYIEKIESVKNKILKIEHEDYYFRNGYQLWNGDGEDRAKDWEYYFFDSEGHISDYYSINKLVDDKDKICDQRHIRYHCDGNFYYVYEHIIRSSFFGRDDIKETVYSIKKGKDSVILEKITDNYPKNSKYIFEKDLVTNIYGSELPDKDVYKFLENKIEFTHYIIRSEEQEKGYQELWTSIYDRGLRIETYDPIPNGFRKHSYKMNGDEGTEYYCKELDNEIVSEFTYGYILARHNEAGFIEKLRIDPLEEKSSSEYVFEDSELLDSPDDILKKYFGFE